MRFLTYIPVVTGITAVLQGAGVWAYPSPGSAGLVIREEEDHQLQSRAPTVPGSTVIPLESIKADQEADTVLAWTGFQGVSSAAAIAKAIVSNTVLKGTASQTWGGSDIGKKKKSHSVSITNRTPG
jgi:hypothetical protein